MKQMLKQEKNNPDKEKDDRTDIHKGKMKGNKKGEIKSQREMINW